MIFAGRKISYIDSLLIAAGACTQSLLNPVDLNLLNTWQQVLPKSLGLTIALDFFSDHDL
jgi:hypothetical protein